MNSQTQFQIEWEDKYLINIYIIYIGTWSSAATSRG